MSEVNINQVTPFQLAQPVDLPPAIAARATRSVEIKESIKSLQMDFLKVADSIHCKNVVIFGDDYNQETQRIQSLKIDANDNDAQAIVKLEVRQNQLERLNDIQGVLLRTKKRSLDVEMVGRQYPDPQIEQLFQNTEVLLEAALAKAPLVEKTKEKLSERVTQLLEINEQLIMINTIAEMTLLSIGNVMDPEFSKSLSYDLADMTLTDQQVADFFVNSSFLKKTMLASYNDLVAQDQMLDALLPTA